ncbi:hypothetical protein C8R43DRAFT_301927 [Mycena crocata]|nr:hypothetical protein C8R43DRAFT_301927 [Mycena crocata]
MFFRAGNTHRSRQFTHPVSLPAFPPFFKRAGGWPRDPCKCTDKKAWPRAEFSELICAEMLPLSLAVSLACIAAASPIDETLNAPRKIGKRCTGIIQSLADVAAAQECTTTMFVHPHLPPAVSIGLDTRIGGFSIRTRRLVQSNEYVES